MKNNKKRVGIILAGGQGSRLFPITLSTCKQLLPIYNKPLIYYPLSVLLLAGIREILIISTRRDLPRFKYLFGDGSQLGLDIKYKIQPSPGGLAQAFILGEEFIANRPSAMILGDNLFYSSGLSNTLSEANEGAKGATIFGYAVNRELAMQYGMIALDPQGNITGIEEKPENPSSNIAVTGLYFYDNSVCKMAKTLKPSKRGEIEISDLNSLYLKKGNLDVVLLNRGCTWLDTGSPNQLMQAANFVQTIEERTGFKVACIEEICYDKGWITKNQLAKLANRVNNSDYGTYLQSILRN